MEKWYKATRDEDSKCHLLKIFGVAGKFHALSEDGEDCLQVKIISRFTHFVVISRKLRGFDVRIRGRRRGFESC